MGEKIGQPTLLDTGFSGSLRNYLTYQSSVSASCNAMQHSVFIRLQRLTAVNHWQQCIDSNAMQWLQLSVFIRLQRLRAVNHWQQCNDSNAMQWLQLSVFIRLQTGQQWIIDSVPFCLAAFEGSKHQQEEFSINSMNYDLGQTDSFALLTMIMMMMTVIMMMMMMVMMMMNIL